MAANVPHDVSVAEGPVTDEKITAQPIEFSGAAPALGDKVLDHDARLATAAEHSLTFWQALKTYRKAAFWSILVSTSIIMEGYDTTLIGSFYGYPSFQRKYGEYHPPPTGYQLSAPWQTGISDIQAIGNLIGALCNGYFTHKYGHRKVMMVNLVLMTGFVFITFFAPNDTALIIGAFLCSIPWGVFATQGPAYAAEVCPMVLRGYLTNFVNLCWAIGQLLSAAILKGLINNTSQWGYRIPFAVQWIWPVPLLIGAYFCPESPWFLVRAGRLEEAEHSLKRLAQKADNVDHKQAIALMVHTTELEKEAELGTSYFDCFKGTNLRRTEIACFSFMSQVFNGGALVYSPTYFLEQSGLAANPSYGISLGATGLSFVGTCLSWVLLPRFGRRPTFLVGFYIMLLCLWLIAILACVGGNPKNIAYGQASLALLWQLNYSMTVGPIVYTIVAEIGATRLRTKTVVLGRSSYYVANIIGGVFESYMVNPSAWNWKGKAAFFWGILSLITTIWAWFRLPETKNRTFEELDILFLRKIPARKFADAKIEEEDYSVLAHHNA